MFNRTRGQWAGRKEHILLLSTFFRDFARFARFAQVQRLANFTYVISCTEESEIQWKEYVLNVPGSSCRVRGNCQHKLNARPLARADNICTTVLWIVWGGLRAGTSPIAITDPIENVGLLTRYAPKEAQGEYLVAVAQSYV